MKNFRYHLVLTLLSTIPFVQSVVSTELAQVTRTETRMVPLSTSDLDEARLWGLNPQEWERYTFLMRGIRSRLSTDNISPIEVLGIHAQSEAARDRYASMWAQLMFEDAERILAFQRAYDRAIERLTRMHPVIDPNRLQNINRNNDLKLRSSDRVLFFTSLDCSICTVVYERISRLQSQVKSIDIYFVNVDGLEKQAIHDWAKKAEISPLDVRSGKVSLNLDNGTLNELAPAIHSVPYLMLLRKGKAQKFPPELIP
ncbi:MAG: TIGR03759 family integrating conjugative element protein [Gammaproteobacteria bacterium]|nr:TIGR03759 family integrating conjugative element protein [Gammaproteobacteria bacterium]